MNGKLLAKALQVKPLRDSRNIYSDDEIELALAWVEGEVTISQVSVALEQKPGNSYSFLALALRQFILRTKGRK
jgi:hypothetical protein